MGALGAATAVRAGFAGAGARGTSVLTPNPAGRLPTPVIAPLAAPDVSTGASAPASSIFGTPCGIVLGAKSGFDAIAGTARPVNPVRTTATTFITSTGFGKRGASSGFLGTVMSSRCRLSIDNKIAAATRDACNVSETPSVHAFVCCGCTMLCSNMHSLTPAVARWFLRRKMASCNVRGPAGTS